MPANVRELIARHCKREIIGSHWPALAGEWSGRWESNPRLKLGKLGYYHYTTPATRLILVGFQPVGKSGGVALGTIPGRASKRKPRREAGVLEASCR